MHRDDFYFRILVSSTSMTVTAKAECVPTPDCASIGYNGGNSLGIGNISKSENLHITCFLDISGEG